MKTIIKSFRVLLVITLLTGVIYPLSISGVGYLFFKKQAEGSLIRQGNQTLGSALIAQPFANPKYFWPRPAANKYDGTNSGATNLSSTASDFIKTVKEREKEGFVQEMRFASASGLDPHISFEAAQAQTERVSKARGLTAEQSSQLNALVERSVEPRQLGILGEARINVLQLNLNLDSGQRKD